MFNTSEKNFGGSTVINIINYSFYITLLHVTEQAIRFIEKLRLLKKFRLYI